MGDGRPSSSLGGVTFDGVPGLAGHSDGDVVCHAIADSLLGAAALGDVGLHFPEDDPSIAGIAGLALLQDTPSSFAAPATRCDPAMQR